MPRPYQTMFLNPLMLFGIGAISIPIIIHLLNKRKFDRVVWAAMRFLRVSVEQNQRRIRIEDMLLLILRCALLVLLALALARPLLRSTNADLLGLDKVTAALVLDNSYSMTQTDGVESRFKTAQRCADQILKSLPSGSSAAVLLASDTYHPQISIPSPTFDLDFASRHIREAPIYDRPSNLMAGIKAAFEKLADARSARKELYVLTDGQSLAFRQLEAIRRLIDEHRKEIRCHLVIVGRPEDKNLAVSSLTLDSGLVVINEPVKVNVTLRNHGLADAENVNVVIQVDNDPPMDQATIRSIPPGESRSVALFARVKAEGHHSITARIDGDRLPADDWRTVALHVKKDVKVLLIDGDPGREPREAETFFLKHALRPVPRAQWDDYWVKLATRHATELDDVRFEDFDAVIAANVADLSGTALAQLAAYVRSGRALMVFPGRHINAGFYNEQLVKRLHLLPASFGAAIGDEKSQEKHFAFQEKGYDHEIVSLWKDPSAGSLASARVFKALELIPDPEPEAQDQPWAAPRIVLRFADGKPALVERGFGQGRVLVFATTADTEWNDLGVRAGVFVPLMQRCLARLVSAQDEHLTIAVGQPFEHAALDHMNRDALITKAPRHFSTKTQEEVKESRRIELDHGLPRLLFTGTDFAGTYEAKVGEQPPIRFATQADAQESSIQTLSNDQYKLLEEVAHVVRWTGGESLEEKLQQARVGTELWIYAAFVALVLAVMETLLAHWFSKSK